MFKKGMVKPPGSGRKIGSKNKATMLKAKDVLAQHGLNPVEEMLKLMPELSPRDQIETWKFLLSYTESKPKELINDDATADFSYEELPEVNPEELLKIAKS